MVCERRQEAEEKEEEPGIQNQKQEPHTKLWGKRGDLKHLSVHQWLPSAIPDSQPPTSPIRFLFFKLPPQPCAVLLVYLYIYNYIYIYLTIYIYNYMYIYI